MFKKIGTFRKKNAKDNQNDPADSGRPTTSPGPSRIARYNSDRSFATTPTRTTTGASDYLSPEGKAAESGPLGLNVIYTPNNAHKADIVFVHGLGGTSRWTWSKHKNPELFWPLTFLPLEPDICLTRIMTFGYNAAFQKAGNVSTSVLDFAKDLLFDLKYAKDENLDDFEMGKVPLIFVVHSMGGLIVKEAYMQGQNDPEYESIIKAISAITFLATPHRGTNLAQTLNRILDSVMITNSKQYLTDLSKNSLTLQKLNEQFRHIAPRLDIVSFYETLPTHIGLKSARVMVLERDSSVLGYPGEISKALQADHHDVCKYESPQDPNYITVRNVLKSLVSKIISKNNVKKPDLSNRRASLDLKSMLAIPEPPSIDYIFFRDQWTQGTNDWIIEDKAFLEWRNAPQPSHRMLWISGGAATGKSVISSFLVNHLVEEELWCQYFFIRFGDRKKRTLSLLLRSLAYQMALRVPGFLQKVTELVDEAVDFETADPSIIWDHIFRSILFKWEDAQPLYWIIDGLDEAENPRAIIKLFSDICSSSVPLRILFTGRRTSEILSAFERMPQELIFETISIEGHLEDLRRHIRQELIVGGTEEFKTEIEQRIVAASHSNFLWVRLAVESVNQCHTHADVDLALRELPDGMEAIYDRMASHITHNLNPTDNSLATRILECVTCSLRVLKVAELSQVLGGVTSEMLDLQRTIMDICGGFVVVDNGSNVAMIHQTARDYLVNSPDEDRPFSIDRQAAHRQMFLSSMRCLMSTGLRARLARNQMPEFLEYAASSWSSHLSSSPLHDDEVIAILKKFLTGNWVLTWIYALAASGQLRVLIQASKDLSRFVSRARLHGPWVEKGTEGMLVLDHELFESWSIDLLRIVGKFSNLLRRKPDSIYKLIPPFCPKSSSIYHLFGKAEAKTLSVTGLSAETWDDSLARISLGSGPGAFASSITAAGSQVAVLAPKGSVYLYDSSDFMETRSSPVKHGEHVERMQLNSTATLLATYGYRTTKVWEISTGKCKVSVTSVESKTRPLAMLFTNKNSTLLVGTDDQRVRSLNLNEPHPEWQIVAELNEAELEGYIMNSASHIALSKDGNMAAVAYRSHPLSAWETEGPVHIGHCWRKNEGVEIRELRELVCHPHLPTILGVNVEGTVFKWAPYDGEIDELTANATRLSISKSGDLFAAGDGHGRVKIYTTSSFSLLYQLAAQDSVFGLTFSPDSKRVYDVRGYYVNAWEPNALMKFAEQSSSHRGSMSDNQSIGQYSEESVIISGAVSSITTIAGSPKGRLYCYGTERGVVSLYDTRHGKLADLHVSRAKFSIETIVWSGDGKYICFADVSRQVTVVSVTQGAINIEPVIEQKAKKDIRGSILQLLFNADSSHILVHTPSEIRIICLESSSVEKTQKLEDTQVQWVAHPGDRTLIVGFGPSITYVFDWDLIQRQKYSISWPLDKTSDMTSEGPQGSDAYQVDRVLVTQDRRHLFLQTSHPVEHLRKKRFFFLATSAISASSRSEKGASLEEHEDSQPPPLYPNALAAELSSNIALALSFLFRDRLVFISKSFGICSMQIPWSPRTLSPHPVPRASTTSALVASTASTRHNVTGTTQNMVQEIFALPGDWSSRECLLVSSIWKIERSLLCPRNGEVGVVKCAALA